jgi:hypothetical protein
MENSVYTINKGINKPIEFRGLKAQYITYLAVGLVGLLLLFTIGYIAGVPVYLWVIVVGILGFVLFTTVYKYNHKYGEFGMMKKGAFRRVPEAIVCNSRFTFLNLSSRNKSAKN